MIPQFKNRPNERAILNDGREVWLARACAVVAEICVYDKERRQWHILLGQRGTGVPDCQGLWGLPCGYLDWDESLCEAVVREVWEECGLFLPSLSTHPNFRYSTSALVSLATLNQANPWAITDYIGHPKQNISMHFAVFFSWQGESLPALSTDYCEPNEVDALAWIEISQAENSTLAFNHQQRIRLLCQAFKIQMQEIAQHP